MLEIGTSGSMSGEGKRGDAAWPKLPRLSSTLPWYASTLPAYTGYGLLVHDAPLTLPLSPRVERTRELPLRIIRASLLPLGRRTG